MPQKIKSLRITYVSTTSDLADLIGGRISQMYSEYDGKMGYTIDNVNKIVADVHKMNDKLKIVYTDGSETLARQAMVVYAKEDKAGQDETEKENDDGGELPD